MENPKKTQKYTCNLCYGVSSNEKYYTIISPPHKNDVSHNGNILETKKTQKTPKYINLPIEIINKILIYVAQLNNDIIAQQYVYSKNMFLSAFSINFNSNLLRNIQSTLLMKQFYPIMDFNLNFKLNKELYDNGVSHYKKRISI